MAFDPNNPLDVSKSRESHIPSGTPITIPLHPNDPYYGKMGYAIIFEPVYVGKRVVKAGSHETRSRYRDELSLQTEIRTDLRRQRNEQLERLRVLTERLATEKAHDIPNEYNITLIEDEMKTVSKNTVWAFKHEVTCHMPNSSFKDSTDMPKGATLNDIVTVRQFPTESAVNSANDKIKEKECRLWKHLEKGEKRETIKNHWVIA